MKTAGLDIGTTGCKLTVFDERGERIGKAYREYPAAREISRHEVDISAMTDSVFAVMMAFSEKCDDALIEDMEACYQGL